MKRLIVFLMIIPCLFPYQSLAFEEKYKSDTKITNSITKAEKKVTASKYFQVINPISGQKIEDAKLVIINENRDVIDTLITDNSGHAETTISFPLDKKYFNQHNPEPFLRGIVTVIAYKKDYRESVIFEMPVSPSENYQVIPMYPIVFGQRNEPFVQLADIHHLTILELVEKYRQQLKDR